MSVDLANERPTVDTLPASSEDPDAPSKRSAPKRRSLAHEIERRLVAAFLAFVVYVLAIGPLYWWYFDAKFNEGPTVLAAFYEPLYVLCSWIKPFGRLVDAYVQLWIA